MQRRPIWRGHVCFDWWRRSGCAGRCVHSRLSAAAAGDFEWPARSDGRARGPRDARTASPSDQHGGLLDLSQAQPGRTWRSQRAAQYVADALRMQQRPTDRAFDRFLPEDLRAVSMKYWTPLRVVKRAAEWLNDVNARHVVDIGSGAGKFCVATATLSRARFTGLEQSRSLVGSARALA